MKVRFWLVCILAFVSTVASAQNSKPSEPKPSESAHVHGPHGLEGWTLSGPIEDGARDEDEYPFALIIARNGKIIHRIDGSAFIWGWAFWNDGKELAYQTGPLHFSLDCVLVRISDWHQIAVYDCYRNTPEPEPDWVKAIKPVN